MGVSRPSLWDLAVPSTTLSADGGNAQLGRPRWGGMMWCECI